MKKKAHDGSYCGQHFRLNIEVDNCEGHHVAVGFNFTFDIHDKKNLEVFKRGAMLVVGDEAPKVEALFAQLDALWSERAKAKSREPGHEPRKVVPFPGAHRGPFRQPDLPPEPRRKTKRRP